MSLTWIRRQLNPRYSWLPVSARAAIGSILDIGGEGIDSFLAARFLPGAHFTAMNIVTPSALAPGAEFLLTDLNREGLSGVCKRRFDYVICSHTIEHLTRGTELIAEMAALVSPGGYLYIEWPSVRAQYFPLRGFGLNFYDDPTHVTPIALTAAMAPVQEAGLAILSAGPRRNPLRRALSPLLLPRSCWKHKRLVLYDLWDWTGYADHIAAYRPRVK